MAWWRQQIGNGNSRYFYFEVCVIIIVGYSTQSHSLLLLTKDGVTLKCFPQIESTRDHHPCKQLQRFPYFMSLMPDSLYCFAFISTSLLGNNSLSVIGFEERGEEMVRSYMCISAGLKPIIVMC